MAVLALVERIERDSCGWVHVDCTTGQVRYGGSFEAVKAAKAAVAAAVAKTHGDDGGGPNGGRQRPMTVERLGNLC